MHRLQGVRHGLPLGRARLLRDGQEGPQVRRLRAALGQGLPPACVAACPCGAIEFGPIEELRAKYPDAVVKGFAWAAAAFGMPGPERTDPNLVIVPFK